MTPGAIAIRDLSKSYRLYPRPADMLVEALTGRKRHTEFRALEGVSFEIEPGTVLGIMGRNGAGKSTLLRIIAGTLPSTGGTVLAEGRIAAILELGTGFHPDYTGRENVELAGLCLGMSRAGVRERFDEIVAFSELEEFIDRPFGTYSTGMQARLTFAVATCVDPDILIVDEALSVGDAKFQLKSFDRIRDFKSRGKSILLVTQSINQLVSICDRAILLERGRVQADGVPNKIGQLYHELLYGTPPANEGAHGDDLAAEEDLYEESVEEPLRPTAPEGAAGEPVRPGHLAPSSVPLPHQLQETQAQETGRNHGSLRVRDLHDPAPAVHKPPKAVTAEPSEPLATAKRATAAGDGRGGAGQGTDGGGPRIGQSCGADWEGQSQRHHVFQGHRYGNGWATILKVYLEDKRGRRPVLVQSGEACRFVVDFIARKPLPSVCISFLIRTSWGVDIIGTDTRFIASPGLPERMRSGERCRAVFELPLSFAPGTYFFTMSVVGTDETKYDHWFDCLSFTVAPTPLQLYTTSFERSHQLAREPDEASRQRRRSERRCQPAANIVQVEPGVNDLRPQLEELVTEVRDVGCKPWTRC
jgi:ABC-type polysaccharide/polyol phosphate transport system ATPase subunit